MLAVVLARRDRHSVSDGMNGGELLGSIHNGKLASTVVSYSACRAVPTASEAFVCRLGELAWREDEAAYTTILFGKSHIPLWAGC